MQWPHVKDQRIVPLTLIATVMLWWLFDLKNLTNGLRARYLIDADVYRVGGQALLEGVDLYDGTFPLSIDFALPFTYPPFAAILFSILAPLPLWAAAMLITTGSLVALWLGIFLILRVLIPERDYLAWSLWATLAATLTEPVTENFSFGQINLALALLVLVDLLALPRNSRWRGSLIGVAMAIKLTPAVFLAVFFVRHQWGALLTALGSFLTCCLLGFLVTPSNSREYWTHTLRDSERIGNLSYAANQSLRGFLARVAPEHAEALWLVGVVIIVASLWAIMERLAHQRPDAYGDVMLIFLASTASLLCSPVSWSHHFVWLVFAATALLARGHLRLAVATWIIISARSHWWVPPHHNASDHWSWWQQIVGNDYFYLTTALVCFAGTFVIRTSLKQLHPQQNPQPLISN